MKESKLIEMKNKVETLGKLMEQVLTELHHLRDLSVGTMSLIKKFPQYMPLFLLKTFFISIFLDYEIFQFI